MLRNVLVIGHTRLWPMPLAVLTMKKESHGFLFQSMHAALWGNPSVTATAVIYWFIEAQLRPITFRLFKVEELHVQQTNITVKQISLKLSCSLFKEELVFITGLRFVSSTGLKSFLSLT